MCHTVVGVLRQLQKYFNVLLAAEAEALEFFTVCTERTNNIHDWWFSRSVFGTKVIWRSRDSKMVYKWEPFFLNEAIKYLQVSCNNHRVIKFLIYIKHRYHHLFLNSNYKHTQVRIDWWRITHVFQNSRKLLWGFIYMYAMLYNINSVKIEFKFFVAAVKHIIRLYQCENKMLNFIKIIFEFVAVNVFANSFRFFFNNIVMLSYS